MILPNFRIPSIYIIDPIKHSAYNKHVRYLKLWYTERDVMRYEVQCNFIIVFSRILIQYNCRILPDGGLNWYSTCIEAELCLHWFPILLQQCCCQPPTLHQYEKMYYMIRQFSKLNVLQRQYKRVMKINNKYSYPLLSKVHFRLQKSLRS